MNRTDSFYDSLDEYVDSLSNDFYGCVEQDENFYGEICSAPCDLGNEGCDWEEDLFSIEPLSTLLNEQR